MTPLFRHERDWRDEIRVGDVLYEGGRHQSPRVVRKVHYRKCGQLFGVTFSILRCSWTGRPYTVLNRSDLATRGFIPAHCRIVKSRNRVLRELDRRLNASILDHSDRRLKCCDVVGVCR